MSFDHQDFKVVVFHKKPTKPSDLKSAEAIKAAQRSGKPIDTFKKVGGGSNTQTAQTVNARKLEADLDPTIDPPKLAPLPSLCPSARQAMIQGRLAKKMSQAQLASAINERPGIINDLENGKPVANLNTVLNKVRRILGVTIKN